VFSVVAAQRAGDHHDMRRLASLMGTVPGSVPAVSCRDRHSSRAWNLSLHEVQLNIASSGNVRSEFIIGPCNRG